MKDLMQIPTGNLCIILSCGRIVFTFLCVAFKQTLHALADGKLKKFPCMFLFITGNIFAFFSSFISTVSYFSIEDSESLACILCEDWPS